MLLKVPGQPGLRTDSSRVLEGKEGDHGAPQGYFDASDSVPLLILISFTFSCGLRTLAVSSTILLAPPVSDRPECPKNP